MTRPPDVPPGVPLDDPDPDPDPACPAAPGLAWRRRVVPLVTLGLVGCYTAALLWHPGFRQFTVDGLSHLGLLETRYEPSRREPLFRDGRRYLWGGPADSDDFDITVFRVDPDQLHYGLGRERFPALIEPVFESVDEAVSRLWPLGPDRMAVSSLGLSAGTTLGAPALVSPASSAPTASTASTSAPTEAARDATAAPTTTAPTNAAPDVVPPWLADDDSVLAVRVGGEARIYPIHLLRRHEVVNDVVGGVPIFAAYCYLAELGAIFDRRINGATLTFAVSGYTCHDPDIWDGRDAFVLWDRETESLWWPPIGKAISGSLIDTPLRVLDEALWMQTTWANARAALPHARVLSQLQPFTPPETWPRLDLVTVRRSSTRPDDDAERAIPPRWNENTAIDRVDG